MAKNAGKQGRPDTEDQDRIAGMAAAESRIEEFAEDLGRLLGTAQAKAEGWLGQRTAILEHLTGLRDTANGLIAQLGGGSDQGARRGRKPGGSGAAAARGGSGRPAAGAAPKKRVMSPEARERIAAAQRARWAKQKRGAKG